MVRPERANWVDKAIAKTVPGEPPQPDYTAWRQAHPEALEALAQRAQRKTQSQAGLPTVIEFGRRIMRSPIAKLAVAAALIVGVFVLVNHLTGRESSTKELEPKLVESTPVVEPEEDTTQSKLALAKAMFAQRNVEGLLSLLQSGTNETKMQVAEYLGEIGDHTALPALQSLASQWQGTPQPNPFQQAIDEIHQREEPPTSPTDDSAEPNAPSQTDTGETDAKPGGESVPQRSEQTVVAPGGVTYEGQVTNEAGDAVPGARVWGQVLTNTLICRTLARETATDAEGRFRLSTPKAVEAQEVFRILHFDHPDYSLGSHIVGDSGMGPRDIRITLYAPARVAGIVVDSSGQPVADALVEATICVSDGNRTDYLLRRDEMDMGTRTDAQGRFALTHLPAPARLDVHVQAPGYARYSSPPDETGKPFSVAAGTEDLRIALEPGVTLTGRIVRSDGTPYEHRALVMVEGPGNSEMLFSTKEDGWFTSPAGLASGLHRIEALKRRSKSLCKSVEVPVDLDAEVLEVILTVLDEGLPVTVQIVDEATGEPLKGISVQAKFHDASKGTIDFAKTNEIGQCTLSVPLGQYHIMAQGWENGQLAEFSEAFALEAGQTEATVLLAITARPQIDGQLVDAEGYPVEGFVQIGSGDHTQTSGHGAFAAKTPFGDPFRYQTSWAYDTAKQAAKMFLFRAADHTGELTIALEPCATLTGRIVNGAGAVQPDVKPRLGICRPGGNTTYPSRGPWKVTMSKDGIFVIENVPVGLSLGVSAQRKGMHGRARVDDLLAGEVRDVGDIVLHGSDGIDETTEWTGTLKGTVTDENGKPVHGATVRAYASIDSFEAVTNREGWYKLKGLPKGVRLNFSLYLSGYGHCHKYVYADSDDGDMQIFPQGWELLGKKAPVLSIAKWYNRKPLTLEELRGKVVLLQVGVLLPNYDRHLTTMQKVHAKYVDQGLEIIAVHQPLDVTWAGEVTEADLERFVAEGNAPFAFGIDKKRETYKAYAPKATPALYLIDRDGYVVVSPTTDNVDKCIEEVLAR